MMRQIFKQKNALFLCFSPIHYTFRQFWPNAMVSMWCLDKNWKDHPNLKTTEITCSLLFILDNAMSTQANQVVDEINSWADAASRGLIKNILQRRSVPIDTILIFANGLYFKGIWENKFDPARTKDRKFYLLVNIVQISSLFLIKTAWISSKRLLILCIRFFFQGVFFLSFLEISIGF